MLWVAKNGNLLYAANAASIGAAMNYGFYIDEGAQFLLSQALQTYDVEKRAQYYRIFQQLVHEAAPWVYLAHSNQNLVFRKNVEGYTLHPTSRKFFYPVSIE